MDGGAGVVVLDCGAGVVVAAGAGVVVVVRWLKHTEAVKPSRTSLSSVWKITLMCPSAVYLAVRVSSPSSPMGPSAFDPQTPVGFDPDNFAIFTHRRSEQDSKMT